MVANTKSTQIAVENTLQNTDLIGLQLNALAKKSSNKNSSSTRANLDAHRSKSMISRVIINLVDRLDWRTRVWSIYKV